MVSAPTPKANIFNSSQITEAVMSFSTLNGYLGKAGDKVDEIGFVMTHKEERDTRFDLEAQSSQEAFSKTVGIFTKASASVAALAADTLMLPYDILVGRGRQRPEEQTLWGSIIDKGFLGIGLKLATSTVGSISDMGGCAAGAAIGVIDMPALMTTKKRATDWIADHAITGGKMIGSTVSILLGFTCGVALDAFRLASLAVKYSFIFIATLLGGLIGIGAGIVRAILHMGIQKETSHV